MFKYAKNVNIVIPKLHNNYNNIDTCLNCMTYGNIDLCPRGHKSKCVYIDYIDYIDYINIKLGAFLIYDKWTSLKNSCFSFSHAFYVYHNLNLSMRIDNFNVHRDNDIETNIYLNLKKYGKYIVAHFTKENAIRINNPNKYYIYNLDKMSINLIDQLILIENSEELHLIDSSYSCLIYFMSLKYNFYSDKKIYIHAYAREKERDLKIYENPKPSNFIILLQ